MAHVCVLPRWCDISLRPGLLLRQRALWDASCRCWLAGGAGCEAPQVALLVVQGLLLAVQRACTWRDWSELLRFHKAEDTG